MCETEHLNRFLFFAPFRKLVDNGAQLLDGAHGLVRMIIGDAEHLSGSRIARPGQCFEFLDRFVRPSRVDEGAGFGECFGDCFRLLPRLNCREASNKEGGQRKNLIGSSHE